MPGSECCEHCAEIPLLREEAAALRARLNALTTAPQAPATPLPLQAELDVAAKKLPRQMLLFGPVHGPPLPQVDHESGLQAKVGLYRALFAGRSDVYAYRWENTAEGTKRWAPKRRPASTVAMTECAGSVSARCRPISVNVPGGLPGTIPARAAWPADRPARSGHPTP